MAEEAKGHDTTIDVAELSPTKADAGADIALSVQVSCPEACDLRGSTVMIVDEDGALANEVELTELDGAVNQTGEFVVKASNEPGEYTWTAVFPMQEKEGLVHRGSSRAFSFTVKPHSTSVAVWGVLSPIAVGAEFTIKVGVKCSAGCSLTGKEIAVYGQRGKKVATGALGDVPWPGTSGLYWVEVPLEAPSVDGKYRWRVKFRKPDLELPHEDASYNFGFVAAKQAQHVVTIEVTSRATGASIRNASVRLRPHAYRGYAHSGLTDDGGVARLKVAKGKYELVASKGDDYETFQTTVEIIDDATVRAELVYVHHESR